MWLLLLLLLAIELQAHLSDEVRCHKEPKLESSTLN